MKIKTILLSYPYPDPDDATARAFHFRVERVTDSTEFAPGQFISKKTVDELCASAGWKVTSISKGDQK